MDKSQMADRLNSLIGLEKAAVSAYESALGRIEDKTVQRYFSFFKDQHSMQLDHLTQAVRQLGSEPGQAAGQVQGFKDVRSLSDTKGIVQAMSDNEKLAMDSYSRAHKELDDLPMDTKAMLFDHFKLDQIHQDVIEKVLLGRSIWDKECH